MEDLVLSCVTCSKSFCLSEPSFPHASGVDMDSSPVPDNGSPTSQYICSEVTTGAQVKSILTPGPLGCWYFLVAQPDGSA